MVWAAPGFNKTLSQQGLHDTFEVVENGVVRRLPIYKPNDSNAKPSGGERQICYVIQAGEAGWMLRPTSVLKF